jgi:hypothetical protein
VQALAQTLERLSQNMALRARADPYVTASLEREP